MTNTNKNNLGYIFEIQKMSTEDGPGIRTTVFFKECPLRCVWCHNPESLYKNPSIQWFSTKCIGCETCIEICTNNALKIDENGIHIDREKCIAEGKCTEVCPSTALRKLGAYWTVENLIKEVLKDRAYYEKSNGGVTASGGEAAMQTKFLTNFLKECKKLGIHTALDTCGVLPKKKYEPLLPYVDLILFDVKEIDPTKHKEFTGVPNERILANLVWLIDAAPTANSKSEIWIRTPLIPTYTATEKNIRGIGTFIVEKLGNRIARWDILAYNNLAQDKYKRMDLSYPCSGLELFSKTEMEYFYQIAKLTGVKNVHWSGLTKVDEKNIVDTEVDNIKEKQLRNMC
ncbi:MAG: glycyl-radical enzyme activating protein [Candidatus Hodarchaeota archaeon]